jgi:hypothetical protein
LAVVALVFGCCGLPLYLLDHQRMQNNPKRIFRRYEPELRGYAHRLEAGEVYSEEGRGYAIPPFLIDHGARYTTKEGDCFVISFGFMPTDAVPELWYCPKGFDPLPEALADRKRHSYFQFVQLAPDWAECHWDQ